jgi:Dyp-type peroxidase family
MHPPRTLPGATPAASSPEEPLLDADEIQGNVVPGFLKPHQALVSLKITRRDPARAWIGQLAEGITTLRDVMRTRVHVRSYRAVLGYAGLTEELNPTPELIDDAWVNIAFSRPGLAKLFCGDEQRLAELDQFEDEAFRHGLPARATLLGDPDDAAAEGNPANWVVGGPDNVPDTLLVFATDTAERLTELVEWLCDNALENGFAVLREDYGKKLTLGKEHFGFNDGVSQPGPRGHYQPDPTDPRTSEPVTQRSVDSKIVPESSLYGLPGQYLIWTGEFVFGYPTEGVDPLIPSAPRLPGPVWSRNGSYLVYRRLRQDVAGFWTFLEHEAQRLSHSDGFQGLTAERLGALLVGRWPSGAPVVRSPEKEMRELGVDRQANNYFEFSRDTRSLSDGKTSKDRYPGAPADPIGLVCPLASHIRKVNTRGNSNDDGGRRTSQTRRILRRGLPYGPPPPDRQHSDTVDRGLLFVSYQASITDQFEFLASRWMNDVTNPRTPGGHDMVIGQNGLPGQDRRRSCVILAPDGTPHVIHTDQDFVIPTGGGYFFSPSVSALKEVLGTTS